MIRCPECDSDARTYSYHRYNKEDNSYTRRRKCISCEYKFNTIEVLKDEWEDSSKLHKILSKLIKKYMD